MPFPNFHALRLRPPDIFASDSFRTTKGGTLFGGKLKVPATINMIWGKLKTKNAPDDPPLLQALRFDKSKWTATTAKAWIAKNLQSRGMFEPASNQSETNSAVITDEKLADSLWLGDLLSYKDGEVITDDDLNDMEEYVPEEKIDSISDVAATLAQLMTQPDVVDMEDSKENETATGSKEDKVETQEISGIEIFSTGFHGGQQFTVDDLDLIVKNFDLLKDEVKPPNKLGHGKSQPLLAEAELPSAGWITRLKRVGSKLIADFSDVPNQIARIIKNKGYKRVSVELYNNYQAQSGKRHGLVLKALAFLGGTAPEVKNLKDMDALYADEKSDDQNPFRRVILMADDLTKEKETLEEETEETTEDKLEEEKKEKETPANEEEETETEETSETTDDTTENKETLSVDALKAEMAAMKTEMAAAKKEMATATGIITSLQKQSKEQQAALAMKETESFLDDLTAEGKFPPALRPKAIAMMSALKAQDDIVLTYSEGEGEDIQTTPADLFKDMLSDMPVIMDMSERATGGKVRVPGQGSKTSTRSEYKTDQNYDVQGAEIVDKVDKYIEAHPGTSIEEALIVIDKEQS